MVYRYRQHPMLIVSKLTYYLFVPSPTTANSVIPSTQSVSHIHGWDSTHDSFKYPKTCTTIQFIQICCCFLLLFVLLWRLQQLTDFKWHLKCLTNYDKPANRIEIDRLMTSEHTDWKADRQTIINSNHIQIIQPPLCWKCKNLEFFFQVSFCIPYLNGVAVVLLQLVFVALNFEIEQ